MVSPDEILAPLPPRTEDSTPLMAIIISSSFILFFKSYSFPSNASISLMLELVTLILTVENPAVLLIPPSKSTVINLIPQFLHGFQDFLQNMRVKHSVEQDFYLYSW